MSYRFEEVAGAPIIIFTQLTREDALLDMGRSLPDTIARLDGQPEPVFLVLDLSVVAHDLSGNIEAANMSARGENPMLHHPMLREAVFVATDPMMKMTLKGLNTATFGMASVSIYETLDDAMAYVYGKLGHSADQLLAG